MLNDPHSLGTCLAKNLTVMNVNVLFNIIRQGKSDFTVDTSSKENGFITRFPLLMLDHAIKEHFTCQN